MSEEYTQGLKPVEPQEARDGLSGQHGSSASAMADGSVCKKRGRESDALSLSLPRKQQRTLDVAVSRKEVIHPQSQSASAIVHQGLAKEGGKHAAAVRSRLWLSADLTDGRCWAVCSTLCCPLLQHYLRWSLPLSVL